MESSTPKLHRNPPPRRGRVKAQIFQSLAGNLCSAAAHVLSKMKAGSSNASVSTSASPPPSAYTSDGYADQA